MMGLKIKLLSNSNQAVSKFQSSGHYVKGATEPGSQSEGRMTQQPLPTILHQLYLNPPSARAN